MKILYCSQGYSPHDFRFLSALSTSGHAIYWLRLEQNLVLESRPLPSSIQLISWNQENRGSRWIDYLGLKNDFQKIIERIQPDLVHAGPIQKVAFIAALANFHPLVSMSWGTDLLMDADRNFIWQSITSYTLHQSDWLIGDCMAVQEKAADFGFPRNQTTIFPWGIDLQVFKPASDRKFRKQFGWDNKFVILCTRNLEPRYGVDLVLRAFCENAQLMKDAILVLVGSGSQEAILKKMVDDFRMTDKVIFTGRIEYPNLPRFYQSADLYVSASHSDGSSVSLMEALACGCPVLVSDIVANHEWVKSGKQGWLFKDGNWKEMGEKMVSIFQKRMELKLIQQNARETAIQKADWNKNFQSLLSTYEIVCRSASKKVEIHARS